jgi:hypothetical protein
MGNRPQPGLLTRVAQGLSYAATGKAPPAWFGPLTPMVPIAEPVPIGRQFDYPAGYNLRIRPREDERVGFEELRGLADAWDVLRLVIETRKDQLERQAWTIRPRPGVPTRKNDPRIALVQRLLECPDGEHGWAAWLRMLLEDLFVIDAPSLYLRRDRRGGLAALEIVDGATIKRILDDGGRTPLPPDPAYQQILKGVPAVDYSTEDLLYAPRNPRPHKVYGFSPVEQVLLTVNIAIRRQASQLAYFTEGNTPEALIGVPESWTPEQIRQFQEYWDALLEGNLEARRHSRFVPGGLRYQPTREPPLKDEFDEWLARVACFAFSVPPIPFIRQMNRATADTAQEAALEEGLAPLMAWLKALIDRVIRRVLDFDDLEFAWVAETSTDLAKQAEVDTAYVAAGIKSRNEIRASLGLDPLPGGDALTVAGPVQALAQVLSGGPVAKAGFNPDEARDGRGRWTGDGGSGGVGAAKPVAFASALAMGGGAAAEGVVGEGIAIPALANPVGLGAAGLVLMIGGDLYLAVHPELWPTMYDYDPKTRKLTQYVADPSSGMPIVFAEGYLSEDGKFRDQSGKVIAEPAQIPRLPGFSEGGPQSPPPLRGYGEDGPVDLPNHTGDTAGLAQVRPPPPFTTPADPIPNEPEVLEVPDFHPPDVQEARGGPRDPSKPLPPWRQSEIDIGASLGDGIQYQPSYKDGAPARYGTPGSVRPDNADADQTYCFDIKRYDLANNENGFLNDVSEQIKNRAPQLPLGMKQCIIADIRDQAVSAAQIERIRTAIFEKTNGLIDKADIKFFGGPGQ